MYQTPTRDITPAENAVLQRLIGDNSPTNKEISVDLGCSVNTVRAHLRSLSAKLGVKGRLAVALWADRHMRNAPTRRPVTV